MTRTTDQDDSCFRAQAPLTRPGNPILDHILSGIGKIYPAATRMGISHETLSVAITLRLIIVPIVRVFLIALSPIMSDPHLFVRITAFHREQLIVLLRLVVCAGICEKD